MNSSANVAPINNPYQAPAPAPAPAAPAGGYQGGGGGGGGNVDMNRAYSLASQHQAAQTDYSGNDLSGLISGATASFSGGNIISGGQVIASPAQVQTGLGQFLSDQASGMLNTASQIADWSNAHPWITAILGFVPGVGTISRAVIGAAKAINWIHNISQGGVTAAIPQGQGGAGNLAGQYPGGYGGNNASSGNAIGGGGSQVNELGGGNLFSRDVSAPNPADNGGAPNFSQPSDTGYLNGDNYNTGGIGSWDGSFGGGGGYNAGGGGGAGVSGLPGPHGAEIE